MPDQGRIVAKELGIPYYETSVLTYFGVDEVFENAIRVALGVRRQQRFWLTSRKTLLPTLQAPFCPPKPKLPGSEVLKSTFKEDRQILFDQSLFTDVILVCGSVGFSAHRFVLAASSPFFLKLLTADYSQEPPTTRCSSETSLVSCSVGSNNFGGDFFFNIDDTEQLLNNSAPNTPQKGGLLQKPNATPSWGENRRADQRRRSNSLHLSPSMGHWNEKTEHNVDPKPGIFKALNHPAIHSLRIQQVRMQSPRVDRD